MLVTGSAELPVLMDTSSQMQLCPALKTPIVILQKKQAFAAVHNQPSFQLVRPLQMGTAITLPWSPVFPWAMLHSAAAALALCWGKFEVSIHCSARNYSSQSSLSIENEDATKRCALIFHQWILNTNWIISGENKQQTGNFSHLLWECEYLPCRWQVASNSQICHSLDHT